MLTFDPHDGAEWMPARDILKKYGFTPLHPAEVSNAHLRGRLWELIYALAGHRIFLNSTDHLSDRALYETMWKKDHGEEAILPGRSRTGGYFYDTIGSYGLEDVEIYERYYETDEQRARNLTQRPNSTPPPREKPPFSRDWRVPQGPF